MTTPLSGAGNRWLRRAGAVGLPAMLAAAVVTTTWAAAPLLTLGAVYDAGRPLREYGVTSERVAAMRAAIETAERGTPRKQERDALELYKQALEVYGAIAVRRPGVRGPSFDEGLRRHLEADRRYLGGTPADDSSGSLLAPGGSACRVRQ